MGKHQWFATPLKGEDARRYLAPELGALTARFSSQEAFALWKLGLQEALNAGTAQVLGAGPEGEVPCAWALVQVGPGPWLPLALLGCVQSDALRAWWAWWREHAPALAWDDELGGPELLRCWEGAFAYQRQLAHQDLLKLPMRSLAKGVRPMHAEDLSAVAELVAQCHQGDRLDDLFLAHPELPTPQGIAKALASIWPQALAHPASGVAQSEGGQILGAVLVVPSDEMGAGLLWDVAVSPQARGLGLGHALVAWAQEALRSSHHHTLVFGSTEGNAPVHRLYEPSSIRALEISSGGAWWPELKG